MRTKFSFVLLCSHICYRWLASIFDRLNFVFIQYYWLIHFGLIWIVITRNIYMSYEWLRVKIFDCQLNKTSANSIKMLKLFYQIYILNSTIRDPIWTIQYYYMAFENINPFDGRAKLPRWMDSLFAKKIHMFLTFWSWRNCADFALISFGFYTYQWSN